MNMQKHTEHAERQLDTLVSRRDTSLALSDEIVSLFRSIVCSHTSGFTKKKKKQSSSSKPTVTSHCSAMVKFPKKN